MQAVLIQQKCEKALKGEGALPVSMTQAEKTEMVDKARSAIVLCLGDSFEGCREGTYRGFNVVKVGVIVYDQVFGSQAIP